MCQLLVDSDSGWWCCLCGRGGDLPVQAVRVRRIDCSLSLHELDGLMKVDLNYQCGSCHFPVELYTVVGLVQF